MTRAMTLVTAFIWESHMGGLYWTDHDQTVEDLYCDDCGDSDYPILTVEMTDPVSIARSIIITARWGDSSVFDHRPDPNHVVMADVMDAAVHGVTMAALIAGWVGYWRREGGASSGSSSWTLR